MAYDPLRIFNNTVITAGSMAGNLTSLTQDVGEVSDYAVQGYWSGSSPVGTLTINASNDATNWTTIASAAVSGNTGSILFSGDGFGYGFVQCVYTATSGTGTLTVTINGERK